MSTGRAPGSTPSHNEKTAYDRVRAHVSTREWPNKDYRRQSVGMREENVCRPSHTIANLHNNGLPQQRLPFGTPAPLPSPTHTYSNPWSPSPPKHTHACAVRPVC